ncbi:hypothetical protein J6590_024569 [Homalodisca vitripennis]|nr:hypothetical protein J6590_024569 [Homalodisca vitripennis]
MTDVGQWLRARDIRVAGVDVPRVVFSGHFCPAGYAPITLFLLFDLFDRGGFVEQTRSSDDWYDRANHQTPVQPC